MKWTASIAAAWTIVLLLAACSSDRDNKPPVRDPQPPRRVIEPPTGTVRPLPPYTIKSEGVGPYYTLNETIARLLQQLPSGPRITRFEIPGVVRTNVIRAEDDNVLIGGAETTGTAQFIAVVGAEVARTETGIKVGSRLSEVVDELGPVTEELERVRDPRVVSVASLKNVRMILEDARIAAFVVAAEPTPSTSPRKEGECARPKTALPRTFGSCLTGAGEIVEVDGGELAIYLPDSDRKPIATLRIPHLVFAGALRNASEGRDELVAVTRVETPQQLTWGVVVYRVEAKQFVRVAEPEPIYSLSSAQARWIGAELANIDLYLELAHRADGIEVGGLLTSWRGEKIRDVAVISPAVITRRGGKPPPSETATGSGSASSAGSGETGSGSVDAGTGSRSEPASKSGAGSRP